MMVMRKCLEEVELGEVCCGFRRDHLREGEKRLGDDVREEERERITG